jgi:hypothetical protein
MPIRQYLNGERFDLETTRVLGVAFEVADPSRVEESDAAPGRSGRHTTLIPPGENALAGGSLTSVGLRPPSSAYPRRHSHPDCRSLLTLIAARQLTPAISWSHA